MEPGSIFGYLFSVGLDVMAAQLDKTSNAIRVQAGDSVKQVVYSQSAEWWQQSGFASIPSPPTQGQHGCQVLGLKRSDRDIFFAARDVRAAAIYGSLNYGEFCVFATGADGGGTARFFGKQDGSLTRYCQTGNVSTGQSIADAISPTGWSLGTPWGACSLSSSGYQMALAGGAGVQCDPNGNVSLIGKTMALNGQSVSLGAGPRSGVATQTLMAGPLTDAVAATGVLAAAMTNPGLWNAALASGAAAAAMTNLGAALTAMAATGFSESVQAAG
jgi:hypothetical protein